MFLIVYWLLVQVVLKKISNFGFQTETDPSAAPDDTTETETDSSSVPGDAAETETDPSAAPDGIPETETALKERCSNEQYPLLYLPHCAAPESCAVICYWSRYNK